MISVYEYSPEEINSNIYVVARKMRYSNPMSFEKLSDCGWDRQLDFTNGGINVNLLKYSPTKQSTIGALITNYS